MMEMMKFNIFVAVKKSDLVIGYQGDLPWRLPGDLRRFRKLTSHTANPSAQNVVIMGRKTWESIPQKWRPLKGRLNLVLTKQSNYVIQEEGVVVRNSFKEAMTELMHRRASIEKCWIIGGSSIYKEALQSPNCYKIYLTEVDSDAVCDTFFPQIDLETFVELPNHDESDIEENDITYRYKIFQRKSTLTK